MHCVYVYLFIYAYRCLWFSSSSQAVNNFFAFSFPPVSSMFFPAAPQVTVISCCIANHRTVGANPMFCDPTSPSCQYYDIGYIGDLGGRWPICEIAFRSGPYGDSDLTLADFALMSAFTYEPPSHVEGLLRQYFPHWRVSYRHIPIMLTGTFDWTSFYEFTAGDNSTSIFAVRGTTDMFDALQDMDLWLPVGMMYVFERLGPSVIQLWGPGIAWICRHVYVQQDGNFSLSFLNLLKLVKSRMIRYSNAYECLAVRCNCLQLYSIRYSEDVDVIN